MGDLVLTRRPQMPKGQSPFVGPFNMVKVMGRYSYILSDVQKWNTHLLKCYTPPNTTWMDILVSPPPPAEGVLELQGQGAGGESRREEEDHVTEEGTVQTPHKYPDHEWKPPDHFFPEDYHQVTAQTKGGRNDVFMIGLRMFVLMCAGAMLGILHIILSG